MFHLPLSLLFVLLFSCVLPAKAQTRWDQLKQNTTFGGYVIGMASANTQDGAQKHSDFSLRLARVSVTSRLGDWDMKLQAHLNGNTSSLSSPRIVDAFAEWQHWQELRVKFGQFKRPFTFENPTHPWNIGLGSYSQLADRLAGFNDRVGEHPSNGRDIGLQLQGDLFPAGASGRRWLHYQVGVFNGQGINHADKNSRKDVIGGLWVVPAEGLRIGAFGWTGDYVAADGSRMERNRLAAGVTYDKRWSLHAEWAADADHADAWYIQLGRPVCPQLKLFARWDVFRGNHAWDGARSLYALAADWSLHANLMLQANYAFVHDRTAQRGQHYHTFNTQLYWRF